MESQYDPKLFVIRDRYKFYNAFKRLPGESVQELASRIRKAAVTYDYPSIKDPLHEALRINFICNIRNETVLQTLFRTPENVLTFSWAIEIVSEIEGEAIVAKDTV